MCAHVMLSECANKNDMRLAFVLYSRIILLISFEAVFESNRIGNEKFEILKKTIQTKDTLKTTVQLMSYNCFFFFFLVFHIFKF